MLARAVGVATVSLGGGCWKAVYRRVCGRAPIIPCGPFTVSLLLPFAHLSVVWVLERVSCRGRPGDSWEGGCAFSTSVHPVVSSRVKECAALESEPSRAGLDLAFPSFARVPLVLCQDDPPAVMRLAQRALHRAGVMLMCRAARCL